MGIFSSFLPDMHRTLVIASPLLIIANRDQVIAQGIPGIIGSDPSVTARLLFQIERRLQRRDARTKLLSQSKAASER